MLPTVAVEVLQFFSRRDLDGMCAISTRLDALMAVSCATYPFRRVHRVHLMTSASTFDVSICGDEGQEAVLHSSGTLDEALIFLAPVCSRSYVDEFEIELGLSDGYYRVTPPQWTLLTTIFSSGAARHLWLHYVDLSALPDNALVDAVRCRKLEVSWCDVRGKLFSDDVLRSCAANGVLDLQMSWNKSDEAHPVSEDALLDFCFPPNGPSPLVGLDNLATPSDTFAVKIFERLLAPTRTSGPCGFLVFAGKEEQRDLADYVQQLLPGQENPTYRFASLRKGDVAYHVVLDYRNREVPNPAYRIGMEFSFGFMDLRPTNDDRQDDDAQDDDDDDEDTE